MEISPCASWDLEQSTNRSSISTRQSVSPKARACARTRPTGRRGKANALIQKGAYDQGLILHKAALAIYEEVEAQAEVVEALHDMGQLYFLLGDLNSAEQNFERALAIAESIGLARGITSNHIALGDLQFRRGHLAAATRELSESEQQGFRIRRGTPAGDGDAPAGARAVASRNSSQVAADTAQRALESAREMGSPSLQAEALLALAEIERRRQRFAVRSNRTTQQRKPSSRSATLISSGRSISGAPSPERPSATGSLPRNR